jgi:hypothetical protein
VVLLLAEGSSISCELTNSNCFFAAAEIQASDSLAPEVISSRLAMVGFTMASFFELTQRLDVWQQIKAYPLLTIATSVIVTTASWIPSALQGPSYTVYSRNFTPSVSTAINKGQLALYQSQSDPDGLQKRAQAQHQ